VEAATGNRPALPAWCGDLMDRPERFDSLPNSLETVQEYISSHSRQG
jgi:threonine synthase